MKRIAVSGSFDDLRSRQVRFLEEASHLGQLEVLLWSDSVTQILQGQPPKFPLEERRYVLESLRFVSQVRPVERLESQDVLPEVLERLPNVWAVLEDTPAKRDFCSRLGIEYRLMGDAQLAGFPLSVVSTRKTARRRPKKVLVTGCYDWLHSGHVRFFEEVSQIGDLYVVVGHDQNVRLLKGEGHPLFGQDERRYMVGAIRFVKEALISSGHGWMDAEPEIDLIRPDIYAVNEDGDNSEKRAFCAEHGLEYVVLKRLPKEGLPRRESTHLRGF
ncbi:MAG: adenylyltransferase/cytidyltransferase family protein [Anaerolineaceae bacterium]|nr:adenylyltransferase/cytidyltransferase family protein [Anaerolineaceae bacterium]